QFFDFASAAITPHTDRPLLALDGLPYMSGFDGENFYSSANATTLKRYSTYFAADEDERTWWARYRWENGADSTAPSPPESIALPDGRYLTVGNLPPGPGTTLTRLFLGNGPTAPALVDMHSRGTTTGASMRFEAVNTAGINP